MNVPLRKQTGKRVGLRAWGWGTPCNSFGGAKKKRESTWKGRQEKEKQATMCKEGKSSISISRRGSAERDRSPIKGEGRQNGKGRVQKGIKSNDDSKKSGWGGNNG